MVNKTFKSKRLFNVDYRLCKPEKGALKASTKKPPQDYKSSDLNYKNQNFYKYCTQIVEKPDNYFSLVIVDGRSRGSCVFEAIPKIKPGGWLLLDNSDRAEYADAIKLLEGWRRKDFYGPTPGHPNFAYTSVFRRPKD